MGDGIEADREQMIEMMLRLRETSPDKYQAIEDALRVRVAGFVDYLRLAEQIARAELDNDDGADDIERAAMALEEKLNHPKLFFPGPNADVRALVYLSTSLGQA